MGASVIPGNDTGGEFDVEALAKLAVETLSVQPGEVIWIWASTHSLDLIEALAYHIRARGAFWTLRLIMESLLRRVGRDIPEEYLPLIPEHELRWLADVDAIVEVHDHAGHVPDVPLPRRRAMGPEWIALIDTAARRGTRRLVVCNPTPALASAYGVPVAELRRRYRRALSIDYAALGAQQERVAARLKEACAVHVTSRPGTDLHLRIEGRPVLLDQDSLPRGEVYLAPHEDSAEGVAVVDRTFLVGKDVDRLRLTFASGRIVAIEAPNGEDAELFRQLLEASSGDKDRIAEFAVGLNPGVTEPVGDTLLDEKIGGSVHIGVGMNDRFGGQNRSNLHKDLVILHPTVWLDGREFLVDGALQQAE